MPVPSGYVNAVNQISDGAGGYLDWKGGEVPVIFFDEIQPDHYRSDAVSTVTVALNNIVITGDANNRRLLVSLNGGDDVTDANRFINGQPNIVPMSATQPDVIELYASDIDRIAVCLENDAATPVAGAVNPAATTVADLLDATATESFNVFQFAGTVVKVEIACLPTATANELSITVRGFNYA